MLEREGKSERAKIQKGNRGKKETQKERQKQGRQQTKVEKKIW